MNIIVLEFEQVNGYEEFLTSIEQKARQLSLDLYFRGEQSGYDTENIRVTDAAVRWLCAGTSIQYYPQKRTMTALDFEPTDVV